MRCTLKPFMAVDCPRHGIAYQTASSISPNYNSPLDLILSQNVETDLNSAFQAWGHIET